MLSSYSLEGQSLKRAVACQRVAVPQVEQDFFLREPRPSETPPSFTVHFCARYTGSRGAWEGWGMGVRGRAAGATADRLAPPFGGPNRRRLETAETPLLPLLAALCCSLPCTSRKIASFPGVGTVFEPEGRGFESCPGRHLIPDGLASWSHSSLAELPSSSRSPRSSSPPRRSTSTGRSERQPAAAWRRSPPACAGFLAIGCGCLTGMRVLHTTFLVLV